MTDLGIAGLGPGEVVGTGGNAIVFRARQLDLERDVAIKLLRGGHDDDSRRRFERERRAMAALPPHDGIAPVYSSGVTATGEPYLVMPLYGRGSLQNELPALSWRRSVEDIALAADAIAHAHANGVLHRDLKPANLMRTDDGSPIIVDFGIASIVDETQSGALTLTPSYAPPEAFDGDQPDERVDVYGLGATLHSLLSGADPFGLEDAGVWQAIKTVRTDPPRPLTADVPDSVCRIIERAMAKEPSDRYQSAAAMRDDLRRVLTDPTAKVDVPAPFAGWHDRTTGSGSIRKMLLLSAVLVIAAAVAAALVLRGGGESAVELETPTRVAEPTLVDEPAEQSTAVPTATAEVTSGRATRQEPVAAAPTAIVEAERELDPDNGCLPVIEACLGDSLESLRALRGLPFNVETYEARVGEVVRSEWRIVDGGVSTAWSVDGTVEQLMVDLSNGVEGTTQQIEPGVELEATSFADVIVARGLPNVFHGFSDGTGGVRPYVDYCTRGETEPTYLRYDALIGTDNENLLAAARDWESSTRRGQSAAIPMSELAAQVVVSRVMIATPAWTSPYPTCGGLQEPYSWCPTVEDSLNVRAEPRLSAEIVAGVASGDCRIYTVARPPDVPLTLQQAFVDGLIWVPVRVDAAPSVIDGWVASRFLRPDQPCTGLPICS